MKQFLEFDDAGASDDHPAKGITIGDIRAWHDHQEKLLAALRAFSLLSWAPDAAPGPSCYEVYPVQEAREALRTAGVLLSGKSPLPSDNDGSIMTFPGGKRAVWLGGMAYDEHRRDLVPPRFLDTFDAALQRS
jgi:hypothetical protein